MNYVKILGFFITTYFMSLIAFEMYAVITERYLHAVTCNIVIVFIALFFGSFFLYSTFTTWKKIWWWYGFSAFGWIMSVHGLTVSLTFVNHFNPSEVLDIVRITSMVGGVLTDLASIVWLYYVMTNGKFRVCHENASV